MSSVPSITVTPPTPPPIQQQKNCLTHLKQYWPALIAKSIFVVNMGSWAAGSWTAAIGFAGAATVAAYAASYFCLKPGPQVTPKDVKAYEDLNAANAASLAAANATAAALDGQIEDVEAQLQEVREDGSDNLNALRSLHGSVADLTQLEDRTELEVKRDAETVVDLEKRIDKMNSSVDLVAADQALGEAAAMDKRVRDLLADIKKRGTS